MEVSVSATARRTDQTSSCASARNAVSNVDSASSFRAAAPTAATARVVASRIWNCSSPASVTSSGASLEADTSGPRTAASEPSIFAPETRISSSSHVARLAICVSRSSRASWPSRRPATEATASSAADTTPSTSSSTSRNATHSRPVYTSSSCRARDSRSASASTPSCSATNCRTSPSSSCASSSTRSSGNASSPTRIARLHTSPRLRTWK
mmetsp:Transcript_14757/g.63382  ORF Transcript_14757/g.63382 Transcript_14757/m.63382 type:complete len:211 (+) Transcript_14757:1251-1883(+)